MPSSPYEAEWRSNGEQMKRILSVFVILSFLTAGSALAGPRQLDRGLSGQQPLSMVDEYGNPNYDMDQVNAACALAANKTPPPEGDVGDWTNKEGQELIKLLLGYDAAQTAGTDT